MGYLSAIGPCYACRQLFSFNLDRVPSVVVNGTREPICRDCVHRVNPDRVARGLRPIQILPGAYDPEPETDADADPDPDPGPVPDPESWE